MERRRIIPIGHPGINRAHIDCPTAHPPAAETTTIPSTATLDDVVNALNGMKQDLASINTSINNISTPGGTEMPYDRAYTIAVEQVNQLSVGSADYQLANVGLWLKHNAAKITVYNDWTGQTGPGILYIRSTADGQKWSDEFPLYPGETKPYYNVYDLAFRSCCQGLPFRVTELNLITNQLGRANQPTLVNQNKWGVNVESPTTNTLVGIWVEQLNFGTAVGLAGTIINFRGDTWELDSNSGIVTANRLNKVSTDTLGVILPNVIGGWAVGVTGTIIYYDVSDSTWKLDAQSGIITANNLNGILIYDANSLVFAVGVAGTILIWDGITWTAGISGTTEEIRGIGYDSNGDLWVCGTNGYLAKSIDFGATWSAVVSGTTDRLNYIWFTASRDLGYAVGNNGRILQITPSTKQVVNIPSGLPAGPGSNFASIDFVSETSGFIVGNAGNIFYWDGSNFYQIQSPTQLSLTDIAGIATNVEFAVGVDGEILSLGSIVYPTIIEDRGKIITPLKEQYEEKQIVTALAITDNAAHDPATDPLYMVIANSHRYKNITVTVDSTLDQAISVQVMANRVNSTTRAATWGAPFVVPASPTEIKAETYTPGNDGWLPFVFVKLTCAGVPTVGTVDVYIEARN